MMSFDVVAKTREEALADAMRRAGLPADALDVCEKGTGDEPLSGNAPLEKIYRVMIRDTYLVDKAKRFVEALLKGMGISGSVQGQIKGGQLFISIRSNDNRTLIGRKGEVLEALQHLVSRALSRGNDINLEVTVDVGGYWEKRRAKIIERVRQAAQKALKTRRSVALFPMNPQERKLVHLTVKEYPDLTSYSEGKEGSRYVVIAPVLESKTGEATK
ncbi:MAG: protein jag [Candidatus Sumerlaeia bacterium]